MTAFTRPVILAALLVGTVSAQAHAQDTVFARVPFDFVVNGQAFHPGRYEVRMNAGADAPGLISVRGRDGSGFMFVLTEPAGGHDPAGVKPSLVFTRHENTYVLSQVWESGVEGFQIPKS